MNEVIACRLLEMLIRLPYIVCAGARGAEALNLFVSLSAGLSERPIPLIVTALFAVSVLVVLLRLDADLLPWEIAIEVSCACASVAQAWHFAAVLSWPFVVPFWLRFAVFIVFLALLQIAIHLLSKRAASIVRTARRVIRRHGPVTQRRKRSSNSKKNRVKTPAARIGRAAAP